MTSSFYRPATPPDRMITLRHFWLLKTLIVVGMAWFFFGLGYYSGSKRVEGAQKLGHDSAVAEYPFIQLMQSGVTFCVDRGNVYEAEATFARRGAGPVFKTRVIH